MTTIEGTLRWNTTVADHHGWLLHSAGLLKGAACIPCPAYYFTDVDADITALTSLVEDTLLWEGYHDVEDVQLDRTPAPAPWSSQGQALEPHPGETTYTWHARVGKAQASPTRGEDTHAHPLRL